MSYELLGWTNELKPLYCAWRIEKRCNRRRMHWYRRICKAKLKLAEQGICQKKIEKACRFLSNTNYMRGNISTNAIEAVEFLNERDLQMVLPFHN